MAINFTDSIRFLLESGISGECIEDYIDNQNVPDWLKNIPIATILNTTGNELYDLKIKVLEKKLTLFFIGILDLDNKLRKKFEKKYLNDEASKNRFYKDLFIVIDKLDEEIKSTYLSKLFKCLIEDKITIDTFFRYSHIINSIYKDYLKEFLNGHLSGDYTSSSTNLIPDLNIVFESHGLVQKINTDNTYPSISQNISKVQPTYQHTAFGYTLVSLLNT